MNRVLSALLVLTCLVMTAASLFPTQKKKPFNPYDTIKFDRVVAYDYNGEANNPIVIKGELNRYKKFKSGNYSGQVDRIFGQKDLTRTQLAWFHKVIGDTATYGGPTAACFDPHLGIVYYRKGKIVGHLSVCIGCNFLEGSLPVPASKLKTRFVDEDKTIEIPLNGFSQRGREKLNNFCKELQFTTCMDSLEHHLFYEKK